MLDDLVLIDVGCRWGGAERFFDQTRKFRLYGFDPDKDECDRLSKLYADSRMLFVPLALADRRGSRTLFHTKAPACSSLFKPIAKIAETLPSLQVIKLQDTAKVRVTTLDVWARNEGIPRIDYLKVDTQGSELSVFIGAKRMLKDVMVVDVEVQFNPIYENVPLFSEVDRYLRKRGFELWKLTSLVHYGRTHEKELRLGAGFVSFDEVMENYALRGGQLYWGDATHVRSELVNAAFRDSVQKERAGRLFDLLRLGDLARRTD